MAPSVTAIGFQCQPPAEFYPCSTSAPCVTGLTCTAFTNGNFCVQECTGPTDCNDPLTVCQATTVGKSLCFPRQCGPQSSPADGTTLLAACDAAGTGDGECLDLPFSNGAPGACARTGTLTAGSRCTYYVGGLGTDGLCQAGTVCFVSAVDGRSSRCASVCDASHPCAQGQACLVAVPTIEPPPVSSLTTGIAFGACLDSCTLGADGGCGAGFSCKAVTGVAGGICDPD